MIEISHEDGHKAKQRSVHGSRTKNLRFIPTPVFFTSRILCFKTHFSACIMDVYNGTALSPKSLRVSAIPEVATGTAVHINLTGVTSFH